MEVYDGFVSSHEILLYMQILQLGFGTEIWPSLERYWIP